MAGASEPAVDAAYKELLLAGESRPAIRTVLQGALEQPVLVALLHRAVPVAFLEELAACPPWSERSEVLAGIVLHPRAPQGLALRLVGALHWRELAEVARTMRVGAAVRVRAEGLLRECLPDLRLGDRITFARLATQALLGQLLEDSDPLVVEAALENPRLREEDLVAALHRDQRSGALVNGVFASRWSGCYAVRLALALQPRTPLPLALQQISMLVPRDLQRVSREPGLHPLVRAAARAVLERADG